MSRENGSVSPREVKKRKQFVAGDFFDKAGSHTERGQIVNGIYNRFCVLENTGIGRIKEPLNPIIREQTEHQILAACVELGIPSDFQAARDVVNQYAELAADVAHRRRIGEVIFSNGSRVDPIQSELTKSVELLQ